MEKLIRESDYTPCAEAQNDIYMCCKNSADFKNLNFYDSLVSGRVARGFAQRNAMNVAGSNGHVTENVKRITLNAGENRITVKYPREALSAAKIRICEEKRF